MPSTDANVSNYSFECSELADDTFQVVGFRGVEEISALFRFELDLVSTDPEIDFAGVVNRPATLTLMRGLDRVPIHGIVSDFEQSGRTPDHVVYRAVLVPRLWRLSLNHQSVIYQNMSVVEIVTDVLQQAGLSSSDYRFDLNGSYTPREYTVQYQETDLNFVNRLLERDGICYYFAHESGSDVLVMTDARSTHESVDGESALRYHDKSGMVAPEESVHKFVCREQVVTGKVVLKDYNYRTPETSLQVESQINGEMPGRHYEYGHHFKDASEGQKYAKLRNEEIECRRRVMHGRSNSPGLRSGYLFALDDHFRSAFNQEYLIVRVEHEGSQRHALGLSGVKDDEAVDTPETPVYANRFSCIPATVQFRPARRASVPRLAGIMTARIETGGGDYAYIDEDGRYRAKMHFDLSDRGDGTATRPIRMSQPYSGPDYGVHFPNHANTEVVWACVDGDLDRPLALGTVPNPSNKAPSTAPNKMQNVIRTFSGSQMIMDDTIDEEQILINTPDINSMLFDDKDDRIVITTTNKHRMTFDDKNKNIEIKTTDGHFLLMDDKNKKITMQSKDGHYISINDKDKLMTMIDESGENLFQIDIGNKKLTIKTEKGDIDIHAPKGHIDLKCKTLSTESTGDTKMKAANIFSEAKSDHEMKATNITEKASMDLKEKATNVTSEASMAHKSKGLNVTSEAGMQQQVKGTMVTVQASAINTIQGGLVKIN